MHTVHMVCIYIYMYIIVYIGISSYMCRHECMYTEIFACANAYACTDIENIYTYVQVHAYIPFHSFPFRYIHFSRIVHEINHPLWGTAMT